MQSRQFQEKIFCGTFSYRAVKSVKYSLFFILMEFLTGFYYTAPQHFRT